MLTRRGGGGGNADGGDVIRTFDNPSYAAGGDVQVMYDADDAGNGQGDGYMYVDAAN